MYIYESRRRVGITCSVCIGICSFPNDGDGVVARNHIKKIVSKHNQSKPNENTVCTNNSDCDGMDCSKLNDSPKSLCWWGEKSYCKKGTCMAGAQFEQSTCRCL